MEQQVPQGQVEISWNSALEELLCSEAEKCSGLSWLHNKAETYFANQTNWLALPVIILSTISGAVSVGSQALFGSSEYSSIGIGGVNILVAVLGTINSYFAFAKRAEGHRISAIQYSQICRAVRIEMSLPQEQRTIPKVLLKMVKEDLKRLSEIAPRVPEHILEQYKKEIIPHSVDVTHPEITNGIEYVKPYHGTDAAPSKSVPLLEDASSLRHQEPAELPGKPVSNVVVKIVPNNDPKVTI
jgi:hypothetical protein